ncbi:hypothetical protein KGM_213356 [Danaus plexippus plexippus]|uniref:Uncharacterized protein n=1 Tax=Danaus plexippus plexippus TaxID=278856 RepID=A0A212EJK9_DANPL|nr:hypothetical protein KGM_213356 [Danaus plexippus plexippus]
MSGRDAAGVLENLINIKHVVPKRCAVSSVSFDILEIMEMRSGLGRHTHRLSGPAARDAPYDTNTSYTLDSTEPTRVSARAAAGRGSPAWLRLGALLLDLYLLHRHVRVHGGRLLMNTSHH